MKHYLFVYGTLRSNGCRDLSRLGAAKLIGLTKTPGKLYDLGAFPGIKLSGRLLVTGEVWQISAAALRICDSIEGYSENRPDHQNTFYFRRSREITVYGVSYTCWLYEYMGSVKKAQHILSGDWFKRTVGDKWDGLATKDAICDVGDK